ncbi:hypothetical protein FKW77_001355 [Venturia effusa]|uniref:Endonuclease/exonuclease/phosphatase domain-containing protein n=1 Tax=Venturia effusa TaxID=50376 RepID=A0A517LPL6_9PEZI|nr:hypothetical protein FKW77_001355 [Venturia effusa]
MNRPISPPPTKRRKLSPNQESPEAQPPCSTPTPNPDDSILRVYSWNINGITPFLPASQKPITSFFTTKTASPISNKNTSGTVVKDSLHHVSLREFLRRHKWPQILCLQEVKIAHSDIKTQNLVRAAVNPSRRGKSPTLEAGDPEEEEGEGDEGPRYTVHFTLPTDKHNARGPGGTGKVYGVCGILRHDISQSSTLRVRDVDWDHEGRISIIEICLSNLRKPHHNDDDSPQKSSTTTVPTPTARKGEKLAIWNIYAVNGTSNIWRDPKTGQVKGTRHDKKLDMHKRMMRECRAMSASGYRILIIGDLNIAPQRIDGFPNLRMYPMQHCINRADFNKRFLGKGDGEVGEDGGEGREDGEGWEGVDIWRHLHGQERKYTYHPRGVEWGSNCDRVDLAIASRSMVENGEVVGAEIWDSEVERGPSDHVPISVDIRFRT